MATKRKKAARAQNRSITTKATRAVRKAAKTVGKSVKKVMAGKQYGNLHELLVLKLQSLFDIEKQLVAALPKLARAAESRELKDAFELHLEETKNHVRRLEEAMYLLGIEPKSQTVAGIRGIAQDGDWTATHTKGVARDAALIAAAQYAEHYEIAGYGSAREWAAMMDHTQVADLLEATLMEEENANQKLNELAHNGINQKAGGIPMEEKEAEEVDIALM
jgi:ferritin-like metal-binding protein YciE